MKEPIRIEGTPIPQGSKRAFRVGNRVVVTDQQGQALGLYREAIARACRPSHPSPVHGPVAVNLAFMFVRPRGHYGKRGLRPSAPAQKITKPDVDKLVRAVLDAMTGVVFVDDAQVVSVQAAKWYAEQDFTLLWVTEEEG